MPKINVRGQYWIDRNSKTEIVNFEFKDKKIPECKLEDINCFFESRYFPQWMKKDKTAYFGSKPVIANYQIEVVDERDHSPTCRGKDILKMSMEELQDLATECSLIDIPVIGQSGMNLRKAQQKSAFVYLRDVIGVDELQNFPFDVWMQRQRDEDTGQIQNPFEDESAEVPVSRTMRISSKKNKILNIIQNLPKEQDFGDLMDLSTGKASNTKTSKALEEVIE